MNALWRRQWAFGPRSGLFVNSVGVTKSNRLKGPRKNMLNGAFSANKKEGKAGVWGGCGETKIVFNNTLSYALA